MRELTRITTEFVEDEDRIRLAGETPEGETTVLWLPQRLLNRLVDTLCTRLQPDNGNDRKAEAVNAFEQMAAVQSLAPLPVVRPEPQAQSHTVRAVTIVQAAIATQLILKERDDTNSRAASLTLRHDELRQWLAILYRQYVRAGWPLDIWPSWIKHQDTKSMGSELILH